VETCKGTPSQRDRQQTGTAKGGTVIELPAQLSLIWLIHWRKSISLNTNHKNHDDPIFIYHRICEYILLYLMYNRFYKIFNGRNKALYSKFRLPCLVHILPRIFVQPIIPYQGRRGDLHGIPELSRLKGMILSKHACGHTTHIPTILRWNFFVLAQFLGSNPQPKGQGSDNDRWCCRVADRSCDLQKEE